ncbi:MAG: GNAT family N-acetyltransferase [Chloroflexota bacterium]|nr:GNAT family N-acetyltransferase [Chloroflexota bacterium]
MSIFDFNEASIRLHDSLGFKQEGRLRRTAYTKGRHHDELVFGLTVEEFEESRPATMGT